MTYFVLLVCAKSVALYVSKVVIKLIVGFDCNAIRHDPCNSVY